ncbi:glycosyltransferase [Leptolyngbya sp. AN02str]|uniref:glycosyltransferase n=1 Tax=Leptolyngbya sp. AN02str TaxID=3423363 RepID=UPI003D315623
MLPSVIFFSGLLLPPSETFIRAQGESLQQFRPYYVGSRFVPGLSLPSDRSFVLNHGGKLGAAQEATFKLTGFAPTLYRKIEQLKPSLVHAHFGVCGTLALPVVKRLKLPMVVTFYGLDAVLTEEASNQRSLTNRVYFRRRARLKQEANLFIGVSEFIKQKLLSQGFPADRVIAHYYGVNTQLFQPDPAISREPVVLFVGRLTEKKGCEYLIRAMADIQKIHPDVELVIIGDGVLRSELEELAAKQLYRYKFLGLQPPEIVKEWMNRACLFAAPSITASNGDTEGLPTVIVEAQSMGLPVIATLHAGIPEAVIHGETGFLAAERDWQNLATYILHILENEDLWQRFSQNGQERMRTHFDLFRQTRILEGLYQSVLSTPLNI